MGYSSSNCKYFLYVIKPFKLNTFALTDVLGKAIACIQLQNFRDITEQIK